MIYEMTTSLAAEEVLQLAKDFFQERTPNRATFLEKEGGSFAVFRGRGGEELTVATLTAEHGTRVRASTLYHDQAVGRFLSTLPAMPTEGT